VQSVVLLLIVDVALLPRGISLMTIALSRLGLSMMLLIVGAALEHSFATVVLVLLIMGVALSVLKTSLMTAVLSLLTRSVVVLNVDVAFMVWGSSFRMP
jgi:hypothetical protein